VGGGVDDVEVKEGGFLKLHSVDDHETFRHCGLLDKVLVLHRCIYGEMTCIITWTKKWKC